MNEQAPWSVWLAAAVSWGLRPDAFWDLSWREWAMLAGGTARDMSRTEFQNLAMLFPDGGEEGDAK